MYGVRLVKVSLKEVFRNILYFYLTVLKVIYYEGVYFETGLFRSNFIEFNFDQQYQIYKHRVGFSTALDLWLHYHNPPPRKPSTNSILIPWEY